MDPAAETAFYTENAIITPLKESTRSDVVHVVLDSSIRDDKDSPTASFRMAFEDPMRSVSSITLRSYYVPRPWYLNNSNNMLNYAFGDVFFDASTNKIDVRSDPLGTRTLTLPHTRELTDVGQLRQMLDLVPELLAIVGADARLRLRADPPQRVSVIVYPGPCARLLGFDGATTPFTSASLAEIVSDRPAIIISDIKLRDKGTAAKFRVNQEVRVAFVGCIIDKETGRVLRSTKEFVQPRLVTLTQVDAATNRLFFTPPISATFPANLTVNEQVRWGVTVCGDEVEAARAPKTEAPQSAFLDLSGCNTTIGPGARFTAFAKLWLGEPILLEEQTVTKRYSPKLPALNHFDVKIKDANNNILDLGSDDCHFELAVVTTRFQ